MPAVRQSPIPQHELMVSALDSIDPCSRCYTLAGLESLLERMEDFACEVLMKSPPGSGR
ncbi:Uncharacterised protein [Mycolicibacterium phlei]|nr:Uncharacterised protein [Mycolicibacterium phlei]